MVRRVDPERLVRALEFPHELGLGLMLNGTQLTVVRRQALAATATPTGPLPGLALLAVAGREDIPRPEQQGLVNGQGLYLWPTNALDDGRYELVSYLKYRAGTTWQLLTGRIEVAIDAGCLVRYRALAVVAAPPDARPPRLDLSPPATAARMRAVVEGDR